MDPLDEINFFTYKNLGDLLFQRVPEYKLVFEAKYQPTEFVYGGYTFMNTFCNH